MRRIITMMLLLVGVGAMASELTSPNGKLSVTIDGQVMKVKYQQQQVLEITETDLNASDAFKKLGVVKADYQMLTGKRSHCTNEANEYRCGHVLLRVYNDGIAFRSEALSSLAEAPSTIYHIPEGCNRWMQQWCDSYEGFFPLSTTYKQKPVPSYSGTFKSSEGWNNRWGYPALLEPQKGVFALITEANIECGQSASCLYNEGEAFRVVADAQIEGKTSSHTPWRVVMVGSLKNIVESTLVTDVSEPNKIGDTSWIKPGVVSWIYWAYNHGSNDYNIIKKYVDMAVSLRLPYVLIDAEWDEMRDGKTIEDAVSYAKFKGVKPLIWYNSSIGWVDGAPTPKFRLNKPEDREKEFAWCEKIGVAGVKIDFFSGDNQKNMEYCIDLLESAARHHLLVNFHGATIPRGWQRTYPNLMSTEGVYGAEWYNNVATFTDKAACHNATLPFTRNIVGPMDYTPCTFSDSQYPHITTHGHELALTVLFESGLQHLADRPESYLSQPQEVKDFLSALPSTWDETRLIAGYPGEYVAMARRHGDTWYLAAINGTNEEKEVTLNVPARRVTLFTDKPGAPQTWYIEKQNFMPKKVILQPRGGLCYIWKNK